MKVFISWSGERSKAVAEALRNWLPDVIQVLEPWMSDQDISTGSDWASVIRSNLEEANFGIFCLTPENLTSPWLLFEAGAVSKWRDEAAVATYLFGLEPHQVEPPLGLFQAATTSKEQTLRLISDINQRLPSDDKIEPGRLEGQFERVWNELRTNIDKVGEAPSGDAPRRSQEEIMVEVLTEVRALSRAIIPRPWYEQYYPSETGGGSIVRMPPGLRLQVTNEGQERPPQPDEADEEESTESGEDTAQD